MEGPDSKQIRTHLADFETTTSHFLRTGEAKALLNFAALFHEVIYLTDTAVGDSQLIIDSFQKDTSSGLFQNICHYMEAGILRILCRDKVVVGDKVLVEHNPSITDTFKGWMYRDENKWEGNTGFTSTVDKTVRFSYLREFDGFLARTKDAIAWYNPDIPKVAFRQTIIQQVGEPSTRLSNNISKLPHRVRREYLKAIKDPWFTNADLWRVLKAYDASNEMIFLHAHVNQQCFADLTGSGQSTHERDTTSLASYNLELQSRKPLALELHATLAAPKTIEELFESAPVKLQSLGIEMLEKLSAEKVIALRRRAQAMFASARTEVNSPQEREELRLKHLKAVEKYWGYIVETFETTAKEKVMQPTPMVLFVEQNLPPLNWLIENFGSAIIALLWRVGMPSPAAWTLPITTAGTNYLGALLIQRRSDKNQVLRASIPPPQWYPSVQWSTAGILGLSAHSLPVPHSPEALKPNEKSE